VSFITTSVDPLRRRLTKAQADAPAEVTALLAQADDIVGVMARGAERTAAIVRDLRTFSRLGEATRKRVDVLDGLEVSLRLLESRWRDRIVVHRDFGPLPPLECDPGQVNQVFMNLLANACDAIPDRGAIWLAARAADDTVTITVRDDGVGMPPDILGRIFDPFFTTKAVGVGTGQGLTIAWAKVRDQHGGTLTFETEVGKGTTFFIRLPITGKAPTAAAA
jgi:signal transduction histidine kinase